MFLYRRLIVFVNGWSNANAIFQLITYPLSEKEKKQKQKTYIGNKYLTTVITTFGRYQSFFNLQ